jgi:hypothetical protein
LVPPPLHDCHGYPNGSTVGLEFDPLRDIATMVFRGEVAAGLSLFTVIIKQNERKNFVDVMCEK